MTKKLLSALLTIAILISMAPLTVLADSTAVAQLDLYPYGQAMSDNSVTLVADIPGATEETTYQWQTSNVKDSGFADIEGATSSSYNDFKPKNGNWYRCVIGGSKVTRAVQLRNDIGKYNWNDSTTDWYITNGTMAYFVRSGGRFNVMGLYNGAWSQSTYDSYWKADCRNDTNPSTISTGDYETNNLSDLVINFDPSDAANANKTVIITFTTKEAGSLAFGSDTLLSEEGDTHDSCPLTAVMDNGGALQHIQMVGADSLEEATQGTLAFVIEPGATPSHYWLGSYGSRQAYAFNKSTDTDFKRDKNGNVWEVNNTDSGMTISWTNLAANSVITVKMRIGSVAETGAHIGDVEATPNTLTLPGEADCYYRLVDSEGNVVAEWIQPTNGKVVFDGLTPDTTYTVQAVNQNDYNGGSPSTDKIDTKPATTQIDSASTGTGEGGKISVTTGCGYMTFADLDTATYTYSLTEKEGGSQVSGSVTNDSTIKGLKHKTTYVLTATRTDNQSSVSAEYTTTTHTLSYAAVDNVITESCTVAACEHSATAAITAPADLAYDGNAKEANVVYEGNWAAGALTPDYGTNGNVKGTVTATITKDGKTASVTYEITDSPQDEPDDPPAEKPVLPPFFPGLVEPFDDVLFDHWFYEDVLAVYESGLMGGTGYRTFSPSLPTTRGMVWAILARSQGVNTDIGDTWYAAGQAWAVANDISDGSNPNAPITREQLAATLYRFAQYRGLYTTVSADLSGFSDAGSVSGYALEAMGWAVGSGIIGGMNGRLNPTGTATRAQTAAMLNRFF